LPLQAGTPDCVVDVNSYLWNGLFTLDSFDFKAEDSVQNV
jgi:hypothetical protein